MDEPERQTRLALAEAIRESADHSSEQALRDSLSRSYYSVFHVGCALLGKGFGDHKQFLQALKQRVGDELAAKWSTCKAYESELTTNLTPLGEFIEM